jgi:hypothetical protein
MRKGGKGSANIPRSAKDSAFCDEHAAGTCAAAPNRGGALIIGLGLRKEAARRTIRFRERQAPLRRR